MSNPNLSDRQNSTAYRDFDQDFALAINKPVAFLITLEQPGGVVKSKQEVVVALAKS